MEGSPLEYRGDEIEGSGQKNEYHHYYVQSTDNFVVVIGLQPHFCKNGFSKF